MSAGAVNVEAINAILHQACYGNDVQAQQQAMNALQEFEQQAEFIMALTTILQSSGVSTEVKLLAVISLKNIVGRCWTARSAGKRQLTADEKGYLRGFVCNMLLEPDNRIALQVAALVSKICRADWPQEWPELLPGLLAVVQPGTNWLAQRRGMITLLEVLRELSQKTMLASKAAFQTAILQIFPLIFPLWDQIAQIAIQEMSSVCATVGVAPVTSTLALIDGDLSCDAVESNPMLLFDHFCVTTAVLRKLLEKGFKTLAETAFVTSASTSSSNELLVKAMTEVAPTFFQRFQMFAELYRAMQSTISPGEGNIEEFDDFSGGFDNEDEDENYHFESCASAQVKSMPHQHHLLFPSLYCLKIALKDMAIIPVNLLTQYPLEMAPTWLNLGLGWAFHELDRWFNRTTTEHSTNLHKSSCIASVILLSECLSCTKFVPYAVGETADKKRIPNRPVKGVAYSLAGDETADLHAARLAAIAASAYQYRETFFTADCLESLLKLLLVHILVVSPSDINEWQSDPELYYLRQQGLTDKSSLKSAGELLFLNILEVNSDLVCTALLTWVSQLQARSIDNGDQCVALLDAAYLCAGLASTTLSRGYIDSSEWLSTSLGAMIEVTMQSPLNGVYPGSKCQVLRSRLVWLIACWIHNFEDTVMINLLRFILTVLAPVSGSDTVTMLYAVDALQSIIRADTFTSSMIIPYLTQAIEILCHFIINRLSEDECQAHVVSTIGELLIVVDTSGGNISSEMKVFMEPLGSHLQLLWQHSNENSPLKSTIIEVATRVIKVARIQSTILHPVVIPMIYAATNSTVESEYLTKDGLSLWLSVMRNISPASYSPILDELLVARLPVIVEHDVLGNELEDVKVVMLLIEAYAIIAGPLCLRSSCIGLKALYDKVVGQVPPRAVPYVVRTMEAFLLSCPTDFIQFLVQSGILLLMLRACLAATIEFSDSLQDFAEADVSIVAYMSVIARILITDPSALQQSIMSIYTFDGCVEAFEEYKSSPGQLMTSLLRLLLDKFDSVGYCSAGMWRRRLWLLALLSLYPTTESVLLQWFGEIVNIATDVISEDAADEGQIRARFIIDCMVSCGDPEDMVVWDCDEEAEGENADNIGTSATDEIDVDNTKEPVVNAFALLMAEDCVGRSNIQALMREKLMGLRELSGGDASFQQFLDCCSEFGCRDALASFLGV